MWKLSQSPRDRVALAWRDELALDIHIHLQDIDCLEILADREFRASRQRIAALREAIDAGTLRFAAQSFEHKRRS